MELGQAWCETPDPRFRPTTVTLFWKPGELHIAAELTDVAVFTRATSFNQWLFMLGDVFEMFLRPPGGDGYLELHVAPGNYQMQLRFPDANVIRALRSQTDTLDKYFVSEPLFTSEAEETPTGWRVRAVLPHPEIRPGAEWGFSFCRYDAAPDDGERDPVTSSTSAHAADRVDFHDQSAWGVMTFA